MREMLGRLKQTHFAILGPDVTQDIAGDGGDGTPGFDVRILNAHVIVTEVEGSEPRPAESTNPVHTGWEVISAGTWNLPALLQKLSADPAINSFAVERAIQSRLTGPIGVTKHFEFINGTGEHVALELPLQSAARRALELRQPASATRMV